jgi:hypothetical protein
MTNSSSVTSAAEADTAAEELERAADIFTARGRAVGMWVGLGGRVCVNGAIAMAADIITAEHRCSAFSLCAHPLTYAETPSAWYFVNWCIRNHGGYTSVWLNDRQALDDAEMVDALRLAAKDLRNGKWEP